MKRILKSSYTYIAALLIFVAVIFFIRCYVHIPSGDELLYEYVWEEDDPTDLWTAGHRFERKISSFSDIWQTQVLHYQLVNGRSLVHAVEQAFTGSTLLFSAINTIVFLVFIALIVRYVSPYNKPTRYALWLIVLLLLFLFPYQESLWTSVNYGLNYLWPAAMSVGILIIWDNIEAGRIASKWSPLVIIYSLIAGWTHEAFVVGLAGGMFFYYCFNIKKYRGMAVAMTIPFWLSALVMIFAPGNISRFFGRGNDAYATSDAGSALYSIFIKLSNGFDNLLHLKLIWVMIAGALLLLLMKKKSVLISFIAKNARLTWVFCIAFIFSMIANTAPYSHTFVELTAMLLILRYIVQTNWLEIPAIKYCAAILTMLFIPQHITLARDTIENYKVQQSMLQEYMESPDGITHHRPASVAITSRDYIRLWELGKVGLFYTNVYNHVYFNSKKQWIMYNDYDYKALTDPNSFFIRENKYPGTAPVYGGKEKGGQYLWIEPGKMKNGDKLIAELYPVDWHHDVQLLVKFKYALMPGAYPNTEELSVDTLNTRYGTAYRISYPAVRKIKSVNIEH